MKESVKANLRRLVKRLRRKYGYLGFTSSSLQLNFVYRKHGLDFG
ncbi:hypothetical protein L6494_30225 (plasmid) [Nostoc sp. UHCC 0870]|nr:hypothetical protein [Nostoc sp. UHCC 0870]UKP01510.1 hypothetical protein L6494_30225 [Nostoc sp. UHCC 0870]